MTVEVPRQEGIKAASGSYDPQESWIRCRDRGTVAAPNVQTSLVFNVSSKYHNKWGVMRLKKEEEE